MAVPTWLAKGAQLLGLAHLVPGEAIGLLVPVGGMDAILSHRLVWPDLGIWELPRHRPENKV